MRCFDWETLLHSLLQKYERSNAATDLGHELGHARHIMNGTVTPGKSVRPYRDMDGALKDDSAKNEEFEAMKDENSIRRENGFKERVSYGHIPEPGEK